MICVVCGKEFHSARMGVKLCSRECKTIRQAQYIRKYGEEGDLKKYRHRVRENWKAKEEQRKKEFLDHYYMVNVTRRK